MKQSEITIWHGIAVYANPQFEMARCGYATQKLAKQRETNSKQVGDLERLLLDNFGRETMRAVLGREP